MREREGIRRHFLKHPLPNPEVTTIFYSPSTSANCGFIVQIKQNISFIQLSTAATHA